MDKQTAEYLIYAVTWWKNYVWIDLCWWVSSILLFLFGSWMGSKFHNTRLLKWKPYRPFFHFRCGNIASSHFFSNFFWLESQSLLGIEPMYHKRNVSQQDFKLHTNLKPIKIKLIGIIRSPKSRRIERYKNSIIILKF